MDWQEEAHWYWENVYLKLHPPRRLRPKKEKKPTKPSPYPSEKRMDKEQIRGMFFVQGLTMREIARLKGISHQRAHQIIRDYRTIDPSKTRQIREKSPICSDCKKNPTAHVHHIDHDSKNNDLSNLVALCKKCHYQRHRVGH